MLEFLLAFLSKIGLEGLASLIKIRLDTKATEKTKLEIRQLEEEERAGSGWAGFIMLLVFWGLLIFAMIQVVIWFPPKFRH